MLLLGLLALWARSLFQGLEGTQGPAVAGPSSPGGAGSTPDGFDGEDSEATSIGGLEAPVDPRGPDSARRAAWDPALGRGVLETGRVVGEADGEPVEGVLVSLHVRGREAALWEVRSDAEGEFEARIPEGLGAGGSGESEEAGLEPMGGGSPYQLRLEREGFLATHLVLDPWTLPLGEIPMRRSASFLVHVWVSGSTPRPGVSGGSVRLHLKGRRRSSHGLPHEEEVEVEPGESHTFADLEPGEFTLTATAPNGGVRTEAGLRAIPGELVELSVDVGPGSVVEGQVTDLRNGEGLAEVSVRAETMIDGVLDSEARVFLSRSTETDTNGRYRIDGLGTGDVRLVFETADGVPAIRRVEVPERGSRLEVDVAMGGLVEIDGVVLDPDGVPVPGTKVTLISEERFEGLEGIEGPWVAGEVEADRVVSSDHEGAFRFEQVVPNRLYVLHVEVPSTRPNLIPGAPKPRRLKTDDEEVRWKVQLLEGSELSARIVNRDGLGIPGARLEARAKSKAGRLPLGHVLSDSQGYATLLGLPEGELLLTASAPGHESHEMRVGIGQGAVVSGLEFQLSAATGLDVFVRDAFGRGVGGAVVRLEYAEESTPPTGSGPRERKHTAISDPSGEARFEGIPEGAWYLSAGSAHYRMDEKQLVFTPHDGSIVLDLEEREPRPSATAMARVFVGDGYGAPRVLEVSGLPEAQVDRDGTYLRITGIRPGRHRVGLKAAGCVPLRLDRLVFAPGEEVDLGELRLVPGFELSLRVVDAEGARVRNARVSLQVHSGKASPPEGGKKSGKQPSPWGEARTLSEGRRGVYGGPEVLAAGRYRWQVEAKGMRTWTREFGHDRDRVFTARLDPKGPR